MPQNQSQSQGSSGRDERATPRSGDQQHEQPPQPDADRARPPQGYDDPLRRERNSGLVPPDADPEIESEKR